MHKMQYIAQLMHIMQLKWQTKCTKLLHIYVMKYIASHFQQIGTHKITYITRLQIYFGLEYTAKQVNEYNTLWTLLADDFNWIFYIFLTVHCDFTVRFYRNIACMYIFKVIGPKILFRRKGKSTQTLLQTMEMSPNYCLVGWSSNVLDLLSSRVIKSLSC